MDVPPADQLVKVLFDVSSVTAPLSGIGRYAAELARLLPTLDRVDEVVFLDNGHVVQRFDPTRPATAPQSGQLRSLARRYLPYDWVLRPYRQRRARLLADSLRSFDDYIYFSPNFSLPPITNPTVVTLHDLSVYHFPEYHPRDRVNYLRDQISHSVNTANRLVTDSKFVRAELLQLFSLSPEKVVTVPLGVSASFCPRPPEDLAPCLASYGLSAGHYILSVGTLEPRKNLERLLQAYLLLEQGVRRSYPLVIVGAYGWGSESLMSDIHRLQARDEIVFLDYVPEEVLPQLYAGAALFCYFSLYEGFGLPVLEAMSSGVPVLCSRDSALAELSVGAESQVDALDVRAMSDAIANALADLSWRQNAARLGRERSCAYTWEATADKLLTVFGGLA